MKYKIAIFLLFVAAIAVSATDKKCYEFIKKYNDTTNNKLELNLILFSTDSCEYIEDCCCGIGCGFIKCTGKYFITHDTLKLRMDIIKSNVGISMSNNKIEKQFKISKNKIIDIESKEILRKIKCK